MIELKKVSALSFGCPELQNEGEIGNDKVIPDIPFQNAGYHVIVF